MLRVPVNVLRVPVKTTQRQCTHSTPMQPSESVVGHAFSVEHHPCTACHSFLDYGFMSDSVSCHLCGDTIGVYEPLVTVVDGQAHESSRAAGDVPGGLSGACFHRACFERLHSEGSPNASPVGA